MSASIPPPVTQIEQILAQAVEIVDPLQRRQYLDHACGGDAGLQQEVERLVQNHFAAGSFLEAPPSAVVDGGATMDQPAARPGMLIGPYKLLERIGEGGMGTVWMAQQTEPVKRLVAVKLIKAGMDSRQVIARFEAERQALALMDHPNIARVLDAGTTDPGRPYFVMDLVRGVPITRYCDEHHLKPRQRLELFIPICQAIQHAHQKGIIHRDLNPSNVLVGSRRSSFPRPFGNYLRRVASAESSLPTWRERRQTALLAPRLAKLSDSLPDGADLVNNLVRFGPRKKPAAKRLFG
jgi:serine/threonine protein kinase